MKSNRIALIAGVVVIAAVVGFLAMRNNWPPKDGTEGTIGAANRYTAQQISDQDVTLKDPKVQEFLQSDTFHQLATNADFRRCVESAVFVEALRQPNVVEKLSRSAPELGNLRLSEQARAALVDANLQKLAPQQNEALFSVESAKLFSSPKFVEMIRSIEFRDAAAKGVAEAMLSRREFAQFGPRLMDLNRLHPDFLKILADPAFIAWMDNSNGSRLMAEYGKVASPELSMLLADGNARQILANRNFQQLESLSLFTEALRSRAELATLLQSNVDWGKLLQPTE